MSPCVGRFAPSPTGDLHLGTARTALLAWLRARQARGRFILRIEDLDSPRAKPGCAEQQMADLRWLGIDWEEGPDLGGPSSPYVQSQRLAHYEAGFEKLKQAGMVYPCSCSRKEVAEIASAPHGEEPIYPGLCRQGPQHPERPFSWRFKMQDSSGDFVVKRSDGVFGYQLACAVDDALMGVSEVVRGEDLRSSAPRQAALIRALGHAAPAYVHVPLMLGPDGQRLAKRHGSISLAEGRSAGKSSQQIIDELLASLGLKSLLGASLKSLVASDSALFSSLFRA